LRRQKLKQQLPPPDWNAPVVGAATNLAPATRTFRDSSAPAGSYVYRVFTLDSVSSTMSAASNISAPPVVFGAALNAPTNLHTTFIGPGTVILPWSDTITAGATGFALQRCAGAGCTNFATIANTAVTTLTYTARNIPAGTMPPGVYMYRVQATGPAGAVSAFSASIQVTAQ